jgi:molybdenum cofactor cytidylyltransferase
MPYSLTRAFDLTYPDGPQLISPKFEASVSPHVAPQLVAPQIVAFTGAGGKTSLLVALAGTLPGTLVLTTTTRMAKEQIDFAAATLPAAVSHYPNISCIACTRISLIIGPDAPDDKVAGVGLEVPAQLLAQPGVSFVLVEADGARMLPLKAPAAHEPAIPPQSNLVIPIVGIDALNHPIADTAHRPERVAELLGKSIADRIEALDFATIVTHPDGGLKNVPRAARVIPAINKVETAEQLHAARRAAGAMLKEPRIRQVVLTAVERPDPVLEVHKRIRAVILAAGESSRMGRPKLLLPWENTTVLGRTIQNVQESAVFDSLVVMGAQAEAVAGIAGERGVPVLFNERYATGEMLSSLQTAVAGLPDEIDAVLVVLGDQPLVGPAIIDQILTAYWQGKGDIIAPQYRSRRGNPVLIGRRYFEELLSIPRGGAPRDLLRKYPVYQVEVDSQAVLLDIDNPADYQDLRP